MNSVVTQARKKFRGISWRNPFVSTVLHVLDPLDYLVRTSRRLSHLPRYSIRVRSTGTIRQFGGRRFVSKGNYLSRLLQEHAQLSPDSHVLEVGCGCGRVALALASILEDGKYTGMDVDETSLHACRENALLSSKRFRFHVMDVYNGVYNPEGKQSDEEYLFPYAEEGFDIVFLISVFTHMLSPGVSNYIREISLVLRPGGRCLFTTFLMDYGHTSDSLSFRYEHENGCLCQESIPEKAVGYYLGFFDRAFALGGMQRMRETLPGTWRGPSSAVKPATRFPQDIIVYSR